jgi:hypothetical protein
MKIIEFRLILPTNVPQYQIGNLYMCVKRTRETASNGEGIEIVTNEPYDENGEHGQYTHKIMHFKSKVPGFIRWAIPDKYLHAHEKSHNSFPHYHTVYDCPGMGEDLYVLVESQHLPYDKSTGCPDNALNLTPEEISIRKIVYLDVVNGEPKPEKPEWDLKGFVCPEAEINTPLSCPKNVHDESKPPEWVDNYDGTLMVAVKLVKFHFHWRGLQSAVEKYATNSVFHDVLLDSNRALMSWAKEWFPLTLEDIRRMEAELQQEQEGQHFDKDEEPAEGTGKDAKKDTKGKKDKKDKKGKKEKKDDAAEG